MPNFFGFKSGKSSGGSKSSSSKKSDATRALMLGLDNSGKTTLLYNMKLGSTVTTIPTIGFNVEEIKCGKRKVTMWDVGGENRIISLWKHYTQNTGHLVFFVNAEEPTRFQEAAREFNNIRQTMEGRYTLSLIITRVDKLAAGDIDRVRGMIEREFDVDSLKAELGETNVEVFEINATDGDDPSIDDFKNFIGNNSSKKAPTQNAWGQSIKKKDNDNDDDDDE